MRWKDKFSLNHWIYKRREGCFFLLFSVVWYQKINHNWRDPFRIQNRTNVFQRRPNLRAIKSFHCNFRKSPAEVKAHDEVWGGGGDSLRNHAPILASFDGGKLKSVQWSERWWEIWSSSGWRSETNTVTVQMVRLLVSCSNRFTPLAPGDAKSDWLLDKDSEQNLFLLVGCVGLFELVVVVISELKLCTSWLPRLSTYKLFGFGLWWHQWVILTLYRKFLTGHETVSV